MDQPGKWFDWALAPTGIYYLNESAEPNGTIEFFDFASHQTNPILNLEKQAPDIGGLAISPDYRSVLYGQIELDESYLMLVKNFR